MDTILTRSADAPATRGPGQLRHAAKRWLNVLSAVAYAAVERLALPYRDLPPEFFRFPPF